MRQFSISRRLINNLSKIIAKMASASNNTGRPFTVVVEGNIGCGKTTFLNYFKKHENVCLLAEPVEMWRNLNGNNLLGLLYEDPKRWSFTFQLYVLLTMMQQHSVKTPRPIKLMERSLYSARYCFVEKLIRQGFISEPSAAVLDQHFQYMLTNNEVNVDLIIYLRTTPEVVYNRMVQRDRQEERTVSLEYLKELHEIHENWLYNKNMFTCPAPVLVLDANLDKSSIITEYVKSESHIFEKLYVRA